jgi:hypothetical protein
MELCEGSAPGCPRAYVANATIRATHTFPLGCVWRRKMEQFVRDDQRFCWAAHAQGRYGATVQSSSRAPTRWGNLLAIRRGLLLQWQIHDALHQQVCVAWWARRILPWRSLSMQRVRFTRQMQWWWQRLSCGLASRPLASLVRTLMATNLLFKIPLIGLQAKSDATREVSPTRVTQGFISYSWGRWWFSSLDSSSNLQQQTTFLCPN